MTTTRNMPQLFHLVVENFGPVKEASIEFQNITVLTGPYNTGKTFIATLVYVLGKIADSALGLPIIPILMQKQLYGSFSSRELAEAIQPFIEEIVTNANKNREGIFRSLFERELKDSFVISSPAELVMSGQQEARIMASWKLNIGFESLRVTAKVVIKSLNGEITVDISKANKAEVLANLQNYDRIVLSRGTASYSYAGSPPRKPIYIPAERLFVLSNIHSLLQIVIETQGARALGYTFAERQAFQNIKGMMRPLLLDYLKELMAISASKSDAFSVALSNGQKLGIVTTSDINDLIEGSVIFDKDNLIVTYKNKNGKAVPLAGASSGVAQLVALIFSLPNSLQQIQSIPFIIIEEPEINLHANHQLKVASFIAKLARFTDIIITTHSEYVLEKLAHLWANNEVAGLRVYYIDPSERKAVPVKTKKETGEIELLKTIDEAVESLAGEAIRLLEKSTGANDKV